MAGDYSRGVARFIDLIGQANQNTAAAEIASLVRDLAPGSRVLDIGAGTGAVAVPLARMGFQVTALEPDAEMRSRLLARVAYAGDGDDIASRLTVLPHAAGERDLPHRFDRVLCRAVAHLITPDEVDALIAWGGRHLRPGGAFLLNVATDGSARRPSTLARVAERMLGETRFEHWSEGVERSPGHWATRWVFRVHHGDLLVEELERVFEWRTDRVERVTETAHRAGLRVMRVTAGFGDEPFEAGTSSSATLTLAHA